jgi:hypothetical protein
MVGVYTAPVVVTLKGKIPMKFSLICAALFALKMILPPCAAVADSPAGGEWSGKTKTALLAASTDKKQDAVSGDPQNEAEPLFRPRVNLRLGAAISPQLNFAGGLDIPLDGLRLSRDFSGRLDIDVLLVNYRDKPVNFFGAGLASGTNVFIPVTLNQVYVGGLRRGGKVYGGFGFGGMNNFDFFNNEAPTFVGKLFVGTQFNSRNSAELGVYLSERDTLATLQLRVGL